MHLPFPPTSVEKTTVRTRIQLGTISFRLESVNILSVFNLNPRIPLPSLEGEIDLAYVSGYCAMQPVHCSTPRVSQFVSETPRGDPM